MFTLQNWKVKLAYAGFGCLFGSICTIMGMLASPVTAQWDKFGIIECSVLRVVDEDGNPGVVLSAGKLGGKVSVRSEDRTTITLSGFSDYGEHSKFGGYVIFQGKGQWTRIDGGRVLVRGEGASLVELSGGFVSVRGKGKRLVELSGDEHGNGRINTWDKNGNSQ